MVRLGNFVFPTNSPPAEIDYPIIVNIPRQYIPGRTGNIQQYQGTDNMKIGIGGSLYNIPTDTDKHFTDLQELIKMLISKQPVVFCYNKFSPFGENGDTLTESTTGWSTTNNTVSADVDCIIGTYSIKNTFGVGARRSYITWTPSINTYLPFYNTLTFWVKTPSIVDTDDDIRILLWTSSGNHFSYYFNHDDYGVTTNTWTEVKLPLTDSFRTEWGSSGAPNWDSIQRIYFYWTEDATGPVYIDGIALTQLVTIDSAQIIHPPGRPNQINYKLTLEQYMQ